MACERLTSLELWLVTLSLQSLLAVVKGLHNLRALGLGVSLSDGEVSSSEEEASSSSDEVSDERVSD